MESSFVPCFKVGAELSILITILFEVAKAVELSVVKERG